MNTIRSRKTSTKKPLVTEGADEGTVVEKEAAVFTHDEDAAREVVHDEAEDGDARKLAAVEEQSLDPDEADGEKIALGAIRVFRDSLDDGVTVTGHQVVVTPSPRRLADAPVPTREQLAEMTKGLQQPDPDPLDVLRAGLAYLLTDPIAMNIRSREMVGELIAQSSASVRILTSLANTLSIKFGGVDVLPSSDFAKWTSEQLRQLGGYIVANIDAIASRENHSTNEATHHRRMRELAEQTADQLKQRIEDLQRQIDERREAEHAQTLVANTMLSQYHDQGEFVVAQLDDLTKEPVRYAALVDRGNGLPKVLKSTSKLDQSTKFSSWEEANDVRILLRRMFKKRKEDVNVAVLQTCVRVVRMEDAVQ